MCNINKNLKSEIKQSINTDVRESKNKAGEINDYSNNKILKELIQKSSQIKNELKKSETEFNNKRSSKKYTKPTNILNIENKELKLSIENYKNNEI